MTNCWRIALGESANSAARSNADAAPRLRSAPTIFPRVESKNRSCIPVKVPQAAKIVQSFLDFLGPHRTIEGVSKRGLVISGLRAAVEGKEILKGIDLTVEPGKVHALMGPNGSGKSTLAFAMSGHPNYRGQGGSVSLDGTELLDLSPDKRARAGLFLSFQYPAAIPGVSVANFIRTARMAVKPDDLPPAKFRAMIYEKLDVLGMDPAFLSRYVNDGFSGGEKKRLEMLQLAILAPKYAVLDETDSGLDVDALQAVGRSIEALRATDDGRDTGFLIITHYPRILRHVAADVVHIMMDGRIVKTGGPDLAERVEREATTASAKRSSVASLSIATPAVAVRRDERGTHIVIPAGLALDEPIIDRPSTSTTAPCRTLRRPPAPGRGRDRRAPARRSRPAATSRVDRQLALGENAELSYTVSHNAGPACASPRQRTSQVAATGARMAWNVALLGGAASTDEVVSDAYRPGASQRDRRGVLPGRARRRAAHDRSPPRRALDEFADGRAQHRRRTRTRTLLRQHPHRAARPRLGGLAPRRHAADRRARQDRRHSGARDRGQRRQGVSRRDRRRHRRREHLLRR